MSLFVSLEVFGKVQPFMTGYNFPGQELAKNELGLQNTDHSGRKKVLKNLRVSAYSSGYSQCECAPVNLERET